MKIAINFRPRAVATLLLLSISEFACDQQSPGNQQNAGSTDNGDAASPVTALPDLTAG